jgi:hypothetical protein
MTCYAENIKPAQAATYAGLARLSEKSQPHRGKALYTVESERYYVCKNKTDIEVLYDIHKRTG